ncbi:MAG TPA: FtsX-like permease family protein, partial [Acidimicrobiales bacterium]
LVAGARRSDSAVERFVDTPDSHQVMVVNGIPGTFDFASVDFDEVAALPGVADTQVLSVLAAAGRTQDGVLVDTPSVNFMVDPSGRVGHDLSPFKYLAGRPADPDDPHEVVAAFRTAEALDLEVGSTIDTNLLSEEELGRVFTPLDQGGATFDDLSVVPPFERLRVVGIVAEPGGLAPPASDETTNLWMTPAAAEAYGDAGVIEVLVVQLEDGADGEGAFLDRLEVLGEGRPVLTLSTAEDAREADRGVTPIVRALYLAAALVGLVTVLVAGQVLARQAVEEGVEDPTLSALGWTRRDLLGLRVAKAGIMGTAAAGIAVIVAAALSPLFPIGLARIAEPDPGLDVDRTVLGIGVLVVVLVASLLAGSALWSERHRSPTRTARRSSRAVSMLTGAGAPPAVVTGTGLAMQPGARGAGTARAAVGTMALGLATVIAVVGFTASLDHLTGTPALYGWNWDVELGQEFSDALTPEDVAWLKDQPDVTALAVGTSVNLDLGGRQVNAYAVDDVLGTVEPSLLAGRTAEEVGEVVVTPDLGPVGSHVSAEFAGEVTELEIVGHAALPRAEAMLTFETLQRMVPDAARQTALVELREGADREAFIDEARRALGFTGQDISVPDLPDDLVNFGRVDAAPAVVAGSMAVVAIATLVHA